MQTREYEDDDYFKNILRQLYRINKLSNEQKSALSKLSAIQYTGFTESVFKLFDIPDYCVRSLCDLFWLEQKDGVLYFIDKLHCNVIAKLFMFEINLENAIASINEYLIMGKGINDNGFRWISLYIENILKEIKGNATYIMEEEFFFEFVCNVAIDYWNTEKYEKCLDWIELCKTKNAELASKKARIEFQAKYKLINILFSPAEIEQAYHDALEKAKLVNDFENNKKYLMQEYCNFLIYNIQYDDAMLFCKEYFKINSMDLSDPNNCNMLYRYLDVINILNDKKSFDQLVNEGIISMLYQNEKVSITAAWSFGELGRIYRKMGDMESSNKYTRHMVVLINERAGFFHVSINNYIKISEEEFAEYMHSCDELLTSLKQALDRKDVDALYIEGRYQEKLGNYRNAFLLYEEAATKDSLRGMCSLALLYYRGQGEVRNYEKARQYWEYCCKRGHRGSHYWLAILLLDTEYNYPERDYNKDRESALDHLTKAAELGSERAKQKLSEL